MEKKMNKKNLNPIPAHNGAVIHHHDQSMTEHSFKTRNAMKSIPSKNVGKQPKLIRLFVLLVLLLKII